MSEPTAAEKYDALWRCGECKATYVVPSLARDCEERDRKVWTQPPECHLAS